MKLKSRFARIVPARTDRYKNVGLCIIYHTQCIVILFAYENTFLNTKKIRYMKREIDCAEKKYYFDFSVVSLERPKNIVFEQKSVYSKTNIVFTTE